MHKSKLPQLTPLVKPTCRKKGCAMRQLLADLKARRSIRLSFTAWWAREGKGVLTGVILVLVAWLGYQQIQLGHVSNHANSASVHATRAAAAACESTKVVASIASDTLATQIKNSRALLPKISFPGLTHAQLTKLTHQKEQQERHHLAQLNQVAQDACPSVRTTPRRPSPLWPILPKSKR